MAFEGFSSEDFCFFVDMPREYKGTIKKKMASFGNEVYKNLDSHIKDSYKVHKSYPIKEDLKKAWFSIGKDFQDRSIFQLCGLSIFIQVDKLGFNSIIRGGSFRDPKPIGVLYEKISTQPEAFMQLLNYYGSNYFIKFFKRLPLKGDKIRPGQEKWETLLELRLEKINYDFIEYVLASLEQDKLPGIQVCTGIKPPDKLFSAPGKLIKKSVKIMEGLYRFLNYVES